jgi:hypothetical protein
MRQITTHLRCGTAAIRRIRAHKAERRLRETLVARDLGETRRTDDPSALFDLGHTAGSDVDELVRSRSFGDSGCHQNLII